MLTTSTESHLGSESTSFSCCIFLDASFPIKQNSRYQLQVLWNDTRGTDFDWNTSWDKGWGDAIDKKVIHFIFILFSYNWKWQTNFTGMINTKMFDSWVLATSKGVVIFPSVLSIFHSLLLIFFSFSYFWEKFFYVLDQ